MLGERLVTEQLEGYWFSGYANLLIQCDFCLRAFFDVACNPR
jgi:hypothetical protein